MSETEKDELIDAQKQVIGILFEVIKRLQANNDLDEEYFQILSNPVNLLKFLKMLHFQFRSFSLNLFGLEYNLLF